MTYLKGFCTRKIRNLLDTGSAPQQLPQLLLVIEPAALWSNACLLLCEMNAKAAEAAAATPTTTTAATTATIAETTATIAEMCGDLVR